jgi:hypothetical protein
MLGAGLDLIRFMISISLRRAVVSLDVWHSKSGPVSRTFGLVSTRNHFSSSRHD